MIEPKRQMLAQISICKGCCCGNTDRGHPAVPVEWLKQEWKLRGLLKWVHLTITGCLGPCDVPNVVAISSSEGAQWLAHMRTEFDYNLLTDWAEQSKIADRLLPLPKELRNHSMAPWREQPALCFAGRS